MKRVVDAVDGKEEKCSINDGDDNNEDDDYLSMDLAALEEEQQQTSKAGGRALSYAEKRRRTVREQERKGRQVSLRERERQRREAGLTAAIDASNKGFQLMKKLGYVEGTALGKDEQGRVDPISVEIRPVREGLGIEQARREQMERQLQDMKSEEKLTEEEFRDINDLHSNDDVLKRKYDKHVVCVFNWMKQRKEEEEEEKSASLLESTIPSIETEEVDLLEKERGTLMPYRLRNNLIESRNIYEKHFFCIWCGVAYTDSAELETHCPGNAFDIH
ncbi:G-patch domain-containing protein [Syncephalis plumigaleata]|nr:G-patch domain-containing protein [Syncephalis plumigaleata]